MGNAANGGGADGFPWSARAAAGDSFIPIPWNQEASESARTAIKDGGAYPSAPSGYQEAPGTGADYKAYRLGTWLLIEAKGTLNNLNQFADIRQSPLRIYPPRFDFLVYTGNITQPATRPFHFMVAFGFPADPDSVVIADAAGTHDVSIEPIGGAALKSLVSIPASAEEGYGLGTTFGEAVDAAIAAVPRSPGGAVDILWNYQIIESGKLLGGFVGFHSFYARVRRHT